MEVPDHLTVAPAEHRPALIVATAPTAYGDHPVVLDPFGKRVVGGVDGHETATPLDVVLEGTPGGLGPIFAVIVGDDRAVVGEVGFEFGQALSWGRAGGDVDGEDAGTLKSGLEDRCRLLPPVIVLAVND